MPPVRAPVLATWHIRSKKSDLASPSFVLMVTFLEQMCQVANTATCFRAFLATSPLPSHFCRVGRSPLGESTRGDRGVDPFGSAIVPLEQSPFPSGERGTSIAARSLLLRDQEVSGFTADWNVQQAIVSWAPQESSAYFVHVARTSGGRSFSFSKNLFLNG
jgi:hypothetical protein